MAVSSVKLNFFAVKLEGKWEKGLKHASREITLENLLIPMLHARTPHFNQLFCLFWPHFHIYTFDWLRFFLFDATSLR